MTKQERLMENFGRLFQTRKPVIGMVHVAALPGTFRHQLSMAEIVGRAVREARIYARAGLDAIMIENMHDLPYLRNDVGPEIVAAMSVIGTKIKEASGLPCGVQILAGANRAAMAVATAAEMDFIRVEGYVFGHVADEGWIQASAGELRRYQRQLESEHILILTDIKKKHSSHAVTADMDVVETARAAQFFLSDGVIITGVETGQPTNPADVKRVKDILDIPVLIGSGVTIDNVADYWQACDGVIVGSSFKSGGGWMNSVDEDRVDDFMDQVDTLRQQGDHTV